MSFKENQIYFREIKLNPIQSKNGEIIHTIKLCATKESNGYLVFRYDSRDREKNRGNAEMLHFFNEYQRENALEFVIDAYRAELTKHRIKGEL